MDTLEFRLRPPDPKWDAWAEDCGGVTEVVEIWLNGQELIPLLREIETAWEPEIAGAYSYLTPAELYRELVSDRSAALLCCDGCGFIGCWSIYTEIHEDGEAVCWDRFEQNHRDWTYPLAFRFEKRAYKEAVESLKEHIF